MDEKIIDLTKTVHELVKSNENIKDILAEIGFTDILKPGMLATAGRFMTIPKGAAFKKIDMSRVKEAFIARGYKIKSSPTLRAAIKTTKISGLRQRTPTFLSVILPSAAKMANT
ncbi:MAG: DUF1858 domain-containing protein [Clostridiales bacterium]|jgi:hypothetical protein|nr:DUF1858 domain-containing protein [Clostridiales bacterium]